MRKRTFRTTRVLTVALLAAPACTKPAAEHEAPTSPIGSADPSPAAIASVAPPSAAASVAARAEPPDNPKLWPLRDKLASLDRERALEQIALFRPLCDKDGYPLVGNLARKSQPLGLDPSQFCAELRKKGQ